MRLLIGLDELKKYLAINLSETGDDDVLKSLSSAASAFIIDRCKRLLTLESLTEYYNGNGLSSLRLNNFPVVTEESDLDIRVDANRDFGEDTKIAGSDIALSAGSGEVELIENTFDEGIKNVKVVYIAGFSNYVIEAGKNKLDFVEDETAKLATIPAGQYTAITLASMIESKLNGAGENEYTVSYNKETQRFEIEADGIFTLKFETGANADYSIRESIGFDELDFEGLDSYAATYARPGVAEDLQIACLMLSEKFYNDSKPGDGRAGIKSINTETGSTTYMTDAVPPFVDHVIAKYKKYD